jgi:RimJ/RimL family protein N-acetyltransferase
MIELNPSEFPSVLPLLIHSKQEVIPFAICQGINPGRIFIDQKANPQIVMIWSTVGYYFLFGDPSLIGDLDPISQILTQVFIPASQALGETGFILIPSSTSWETIIPTILPDREVIEIYRRPHILDFNFFRQKADWRMKIPPGFHFQSIDESIALKIGVLASWSSVDDFITNGIGYAMMKGGEIASTCISVFSSLEKVEIDVHTNEKFRRQGLAELVCTAFIEKCIQSGKTPNWECFSDNELSQYLAKKLGFVALDDYPVFYWEEKTP